MDNKIRFGIAGCGNIARRHAAEAGKYGIVTAICDSNIKKAETLGSAYGGKPYATLDELLEAHPEIDVISICTPNYLHTPQAIQCLNHHKHVLCEKPMAITVSDGRKMIEVAKRMNKRLFVVKQNRYNPPIALLKQLLMEGRLGRLFSFQVNGFWNRDKAYYTDWRGKKATDGGTLFTQFSHFIDLITWLFGSIVSVQSSLANLNHPYIEFEDTGLVNFRMHSGAIGSFNYSVNSFHKNMEGSVTAFCEKGTLKIGGQYLNELEYFQVEGMEKPALPIGNGANNYGFYQGSMSNHDKIYQHLVHALNDPGYPFLEAAEAIETIEIIEKIYNNAP